MTDEEINPFQDFTPAMLLAFVYLEGGEECLQVFLDTCTGNPPDWIMKRLESATAFNRPFLETYGDCVQSSQESLLEIASELSIMELERASQMTFTAAGRAKTARELRADKDNAYAAP